MLKSRDDPIKKTVKKSVCKHCGGKGSVVEIVQKTEPCISCRGIGKVRNTSCFVCGGTGALSITRTVLVPCEPCAGTGWVIEEPAYA